MTGRVPDGDDRLAKGELIAVRDLFVIEAVFRVFLVAHENLRGLHAIAELPRAADEIGVDVRLEDMRDRDLLLAGQFDVFFYIGCGIEHRCHAVAIVAEHVRKLCDAFGLDTFKDECHGSCG